MFGVIQTGHTNLNVNMTHQRLWILQKHFPGNWDYRLVFSTLMLSLLLGADWVFGRIVGRPRAIVQA